MASARIEKSIPQKRRIDNISDKNQRRNKFMKKMVALALAITMLVSLASAASAATLSISVRCDSTTNYTQSSEEEYKTTGTAAIYVNHHDNVDTDEYTNHFRGQLVSGDTRTTKGSKWCTQGLNVPIQNNNIVRYKKYSVSGRGNTNYYNYDGISSIVLRGSFNPNL